ncbi:helix-turn-helix domain-containing protein [Thalassobius sp. Cn5-15]|jgi:DNA-binding XRE family transcriptional regulator|uniref:helix-turn-helix domain-containing protein n=1 Tax=Thalassobius sp. Cn5-15 TaxID=2917763 RepID=UPI001EF19097|nr:helix-turn-helix transcriptional regulator [Thalassobius sp. Cn5-15]MCG7494237.1 helix-turn-helix domain-containing protein [Thalassobius sp. Cn5-15]
MSTSETNIEHDGHALAKIRRGFGWSQDELADALRISPSTLSRWERAPKMMNHLVVSRRHPNRTLAYLRAMVEPAILDGVMGSDRIGGLFYGESYILVAISQGMAQRYHLTGAAVGFPAMPFVRGVAARAIHNHIDQIRAVSRTPGSGAIWRIPSDLSMIVKDGWTISFNAIGGNMVSADVELMRPEEAHLHEGAPVEFFGL